MISVSKIKVRTLRRYNLQRHDDGQEPAQNLSRQVSIAIEEILSAIEDEMNNAGILGPEQDRFSVGD